MFYGHVVVFANPIPPVVFCPSFAPLFLETRCILDLIHQSEENHDSSRPARQRSSHQTPKRIINVIGAVIVKDGKILCAQRGEGRSLAGCWEFPGGKIEPHETARQALHHEIEEELMCDIEVADKVCISSYDYDFGTVVLTSFICHLLNGTPHLTEHHEMRWLVPSEISSLDWAPADRETVRLLSTMNLARK